MIGEPSHFLFLNKFLGLKIGYIHYNVKVIQTFKKIKGPLLFNC